MEFSQVLKTRRSVRAYEARPVTDDRLQQILEAANSAPSAGNLQAYEVMVVRDAAVKRLLVQAALGQEFLAQAPVVLAFFAHPHRSELKYRKRGAELYCLQDATIACAYAQLAAVALGLGSVWVGAFDDAAVSQALKVGPEWRPIALLPVGHPAESPGPAMRRTLDNLVHEVRSP